MKKSNYFENFVKKTEKINLNFFQKNFMFFIDCYLYKGYFVIIT